MLPKPQHEMLTWNPIEYGKPRYSGECLITRAIDGKPYPSVQEWQPLTAKEKFQVFLHSTYSPRTFFNAALDEAGDRAKGRHLNREYETGALGVGQRYASKGGYIVRFAQGVGTDLVPETDWIVP